MSVFPAGAEERDSPALEPRSGFRRRPVPLSIAIPAVVTGVLVAVPLVYVFVRALERGVNNYLRILGSADAWGLLLNTLSLVAAVVAVSLLMALPMAWLVTRTDLPAKRFWTMLGAAPLLFPSYISAFAVVSVLGPRGHLQGLLFRAGGVEALPEVAYGFSGALIALALFTYPYVYLLLIAALRNLDPALEEASRLLNRGRLETFLRVELPQLRPAMYGGSLLIVLYTLSDFGAVSIVRFNTFTLAIYNAYRGLFDRTVAAALSTVLIMITVGFIVAEVRLLRGLRPAPPSIARRRSTVTLGPWKWVALIFLLIQAVFAVGIPMGTIVAWTVRGLTSGTSGEATWQAATNSIACGLAVAVLAVLLSVAPTLWTTRFRSPTGVVVERLSAAGHALPGIVIALSLVFVATRMAPAIYQTIWLLLIGYVVRFLPESIAALRSSLLLVPEQVEEAGRTLGRSLWGVVLTVTLPLVRNGILAGGSLVFLTTMKELPATLILRPIGFETLATRVWTTAAEGFYGQTGLPALLLVAASLAPVYLFLVRPILQDRTPATMGES